MTIVFYVMYSGKFNSTGVKKYTSENHKSKGPTLRRLSAEKAEQENK